MSKVERERERKEPSQYALSLHKNTEIAFAIKSTTWKKKKNKEENNNNNNKIFHTPCWCNQQCACGATLATRNHNRPRVLLSWFSVKEQIHIKHLSFNNFQTIESNSKKKTTLCIYNNLHVLCHHYWMNTYMCSLLWLYTSRRPWLSKKKSIQEEGDFVFSQRQMRCQKKNKILNLGMWIHVALEPQCQCFCLISIRLACYRRAVWSKENVSD